MEEFIEGLVLGVIIATSVCVGIAMASTFQHDVGMGQNVCMYIDDQSSQECISAAKLLEILRKKR